MEKVRTYLFIFLILTLLTSSAASAGDPSTWSPPPGGRSIESGSIVDTDPGSPGQLQDLTFIENLGQFDPQARFHVRDRDGRSFWLTDDSIWITLVNPPSGTTAGVVSDLSSEEWAQASPAGTTDARGINLRLSFTDANANVRLVPFGRQAGALNYLVGNDPQAWHTDVPRWEGVRYVNLYPGVDLELSSSAGRVTFRMYLRSKEYLDVVAFEIVGQDGLVLEGDQIVLSTPLGELELPLPQVVSHLDFDLPQPSLEGNRIQAPFAIAPPWTDEQANGLNLLRPTGASPGTILFATFLGGTGSQFGQDVVIDSSDGVIVVGSTYSSDFPTTPGSFQTEFGGGRQPSDAFVAKFNADGSDLIFATFLGGSGDDRGYGVDLDSEGAVYISGQTNSDDFPTTTGAFDTTYGGGVCGIGFPCNDGFVTKLNPTGTQVVYSGYIGGDENDIARDIAVDMNGAAYAVGGIANESAFVKKISPDGSDLVYDTILDGSGGDLAVSVVVNISGNAFVAGQTTSDDFPVTPGAYQAEYQGGLCGPFEATGPCLDLFVVKLASVNGAITYATYLGGGRSETWPAIDIDAAGHAFVAGQTSSSDYPTTPGALQTEFGGANDVFVSKLNLTGTDLLYSTLRGGSGDEYAGGLAVDRIGQAFLLYNAGGEAVFEEINTDGDALLASASLAGSDVDNGYSINIGSCCAYLTGYTRSDDFPATPGAYQTTMGGGSDAFVAKIEAIVHNDYTLQTTEQGFDKCVHPSVSEMEVWWTHSEYHYIGIYIGGESRACAQPDLNASWISAVAAQGWAFIPIWVGPQAPRWANPGAPPGERRVCANRNFGSQIDLEPATARDQGIQEASDAIEAAYELGLADEARSGTIIYYDMERFVPGEPECDQAVDGFLEGWTSELQRQGNKAGVYGHAVNVKDWHDLTPRLDAVWFAYYPTQQCPDPKKGNYCYDPQVDVYDNPYMPDEHWEQGRLRQYNNSHEESYGDIEFSIDSDAADGIVALPAGSAPSGFFSLYQEAPTVSSPAVSGLEFTVEDMDLLASGEGWALINNRLRWTSDGGDNWKDITPSAGDILEAVFFLNTQQGWVISASTDGPGVLSDLYLSTTSDGGQTWGTSAFTPFDPGQGYGAIYLDFVDAQNGWVVIRLPSSSNYRFGELYRTQDGGSSWTKLEVPIGEPVNFISATDGWVAGGAAGDELYVSRDGGVSWQAQEVASKAPGGGYLVYHLPTFADEQEGILPVVVNDLPDTRVEFFGTSDGGDTWTPIETADLPKEVRPGTTFPIAVTETGDRFLPIPESLPDLPDGVTMLEFFGEDHGWALATNHVCEGGLEFQGVEGTTCAVQSQLFQTEDGGGTWSEDILPVETLYLPIIVD